VYRPILVAAVTGMLCVGALSAAPASIASSSRALTVDGAVSAPASYTPTELAALPQTTLPVARRHAPATVTGVSLQDLVQLSAPLLPDAKNALLRVTITISTAGHRKLSLALGELDPSFGNNPALVTVNRHGHHGRTVIGLVVPGDRSNARSLAGVTHLRVAVSNDAATLPAQPGSINVVKGHRNVTLSAEQLSALPNRTLTVSFLAGTEPQQHTETGPSPRRVLAAAHVRTCAATSIAAVGSDGYIATVTLAEQTTAGKPLLISTVEDGVALVQPRLVVDGDVKGGRYVSDLVNIVVSSAGCGRAHH
jgi:hypothetical protein